MNRNAQDWGRKGSTDLWNRLQQHFHRYGQCTNWSRSGECCQQKSDCQRVGQTECGEFYGRKERTCIVTLLQRRRE